MAWSLPFTGKRSIITDSYQRLSLSVSSDRLNVPTFRPKILELAHLGFLHITVTVLEKTLSGDLNNVFSDLQALLPLVESVEMLYSPEQGTDASSVAPSSSADLRRPKRLFLSIQIPHHAVSFAKALAAFAVPFDLWLVQVRGDKPTALKNLLTISETLSTTVVSPSLGLSGCQDPMELDWFLTKIPYGGLKVVHLGDVVLPDLKLHSIELTHTLGYNVMLDITAEALRSNINSNPRLGELAAKYSIPPDTFLIKSLLQLGATVSLPFEALDGAYLQEHYSRLCHPFVHRKLFVSSHRVVTLLIQAEDLVVLTAASEAHEALTDTFWQPHAQGRTEERELTYVK